MSKRSFPSVDIKNLTLDQATEIWLDNFWTPNRLDEIHDQTLANKLLNMIGNSGAHSVILQFQAAINLCGGSVILDGVMGTSTLAAANFLDPKYLIAIFKIQRIGFYIGLVNRTSSQISNLKGWVTRTLT